MIAMTPGDTSGDVYGDSNARTFTPIYAPEGASGNATSVTSAPAPTPLPAVTGAQLVSSLAPFVPSTISPVVAALTQVVGEAPVGLLYAGNYHPSAPSASGSYAAPPSTSPVAMTGTSGSQSGTPVGIGGDTGVGGGFPALATTEPVAAGATSATTATLPGGISTRTWLIAVAVLFLVLR